MTYICRLAAEWVIAPRANTLSLRAQSNTRLDIQANQIPATHCYVALSQKALKILKLMLKNSLKTVV